MKRYDWNLSNRKKNAKIYYELFEKLSDKVKLTTYSKDNSFFLFQIFVKDLDTRNKLIMFLKERQIGCSIHYAVPVPMMSYYQNKYKYTADMFPNAMEYSNTNISLPIHPFLDEKSIKMIFNIIVGFYK
jgi:dTDP-4-amino-4,6-dideoxygalactose transaminase